MGDLSLNRAKLQLLLEESNLDFWSIMHVNPVDAGTFNQLFYDPYIRVVDSSKGLIVFSFSLIKSGLRHDLKIHNYDFYSAFKAYIDEWELHTFDGNPEFNDIRRVLLKHVACLAFTQPFTSSHETVSYE